MYLTITITLIDNALQKYYVSDFNYVFIMGTVLKKMVENLK